jgi:hypothetical protein
MDLSKSIQAFYKTVIESSSDEESDDDTEMMMVAAMLLHEHTSRLVYRGSKGRKPNVKRNYEKGPLPALSRLVPSYQPNL